MQSPSVKTIIRYIRGIIYYEIFIALASSLVVFRSNSKTAMFPLLFAFAAISCLSLMLHTMKAAAKGDTQRYPYGTGRMENLSAIILALMLAAGAMVPLTQGIRSFYAVSPPPVAMGWALALLLVSALGNGMQAYGAKRLGGREGNAPVIASLYHCYHAGCIRNAFSCAIIGLLMSMKGGNPIFMSRLDSAASVIMGIYVLYRFTPQILRNFRSLADFPISEKQQLQIMAVLAKYFDAYKMPGHIFTTNKGRTTVLEIELAFPADLPLQKLIEIEARMRSDFELLFTDCIFRIIPLVHSNTPRVGSPDDAHDTLLSC